MTTLLFLMGHMTGHVLFLPPLLAYFDLPVQGTQLGTMWAEILHCCKVTTSSWRVSGTKNQLT